LIQVKEIGTGWSKLLHDKEKKAVRVAVEVTPGVRAVNDNLIIRPAHAGY
jgi:hypothetical protein